MASKIQRLVSQARATFSKHGAEPFKDELQRLKDLISSLTAEDFSLSRSVTSQEWNYLPYVHDSPASCMEVYECPDFSVGIFLIKPNKMMPLHDHPGMNGIMKVLFGSMTVTSYSQRDSKQIVQEGTPLLCKFYSQKVLDPTSEPCVLHSLTGNIHQIQANNNVVAFLDILAPPYNPSEGRDCTYYERLDEGDGKGSSIRLLPGPNPSWFSCVPLSYTGPKPS